MNINDSITKTIIVILFLIVPFTGIIHSQTTRYVNVNGSDDQNDCTTPGSPCATISHALDVADSNDAINISEGIYTERITIHKSISLHGAGQDTLTGTVIQAHSDSGMASGRVIYVVDGGHTVSIDNLIIRHGKALGGGQSGRGGGIRVVGSNVILTDVTLEKNIATYGGGIHNADALGSYTNVIFSKNIALLGSSSNQGTGGGIYNFRSSPTLQNVFFYNNKADRYGGGIRNIESAPVLLNVTFEGDSAKFGGGIFNSPGSSPILNEVSFISTAADSLGGGIYNSSSSPGLENVTFENNSAYQGGGMFNLDKSNPTLQNVTFLSNSAVNGGGIFNTEQSSLILNNVTFEDNTADSLGGGLCSYQSSPAFTDVLFDGNEAGFSGGGMYINGEDSSPLLTNVTFNNNSAVRGGGMFNGNDCNPNLEVVTFSGNEADNGGGIYNDIGTYLTLEDVTFSENTAEGSGGGLYDLSDNSELTNIDFIGNTAFLGGGMFNSSSSYTHTGLIFTDNLAYGGGGLYNSEGNGSLRNITFRNNTAALAGGGLIEDNDGGTDSRLFVNALFFGNSAPLGGGIYNFDHCVSTFLNTVFSGNTADSLGGGVFVSLGSSPTLLNTIVWGNTADTDGDEFYIESQEDTVHLIYSLYANGNGDFGGEGNLLLENSFSDNPLFVDADNGDFHLMEGSSAIDVGMPNTSPYLFPVNVGTTDPIDLDGNPRFYNKVIDIGAYEFHGTTSAETQGEVLTEFALHQNYPNPFNPTTSLSFVIGSASGESFVSLKVYDVLGNEVAILINEEKPAGVYEIKFDASYLSSGVYFYKLKVKSLKSSKSFSETKKMILMK